MSEIKLNKLDSINYVIDKRNDLIENLNDVLKVNDSVSEKKSLELLQEIFKINSQIKLEEDALVLNGRIYPTELKLEWYQKLLGAFKNRRY